MGPLGDDGFYLFGTVCCSGHKAPDIPGYCIALGDSGISKVVKVFLENGKDYLRMLFGLKLLDVDTDDTANEMKVSLTFALPKTCDDASATPAKIVVSVKREAKEQFEKFVQKLRDVQTRTIKKLPSLKKVQSEVEDESIGTNTSCSAIQRNIGPEQTSNEIDKSTSLTPPRAASSALSTSSLSKPYSPSSNRKRVRRRIRRLDDDDSSSDSGDDCKTSDSRRIPSFKSDLAESEVSVSPNFKKKIRSSSIWNPNASVFGRSKPTQVYNPYKQKPNAHSKPDLSRSPYIHKTSRFGDRERWKLNPARLTPPPIKRSWRDLDPFPRDSSPSVANRKRCSALSPSERKAPGVRNSHDIVPKFTSTIEPATIKPDFSSIVANEPGLINLGNTCYMNCIIQATLAYKGFVRHLVASVPTLDDGRVEAIAAISNVVDNLENAKESLRDQPGAPTITPPMSHRNSYSASTSPVSSNWQAPVSRNPFSTPPTTRGFRGTRNAAVNPCVLKDAIAKNEPEFKGNRQHDAHEFLMACLDAWDEEFKRVAPKESETNSITPKSPVDTFFSSVVVQTFTCTDCGYSRSREETSRVFSLGLNRSTSNPDSSLHLGKLFNKHFEPEELEYKCEKCDSQTAQVTHALKVYPKCLVLHLKRFEMNDTMQHFIKRHDEVNPPLKLNLARYVPLMKDSATETSKNPQSPLYLLKSVIKHSGNTAFSGHYTTVVNNAGDGKRDDQKDWLLYNDTLVSRVTEYTAAHSPEAKEAGYMMFYELQ